MARAVGSPGVVALGRRAREVVALVRDTFREFVEDRAVRLAAAVAFYSIFSLAPLLVVLVGLAGLAVGNAAARTRLLDTLSGVVGPQAATLLADALEAGARGGGGVVATVVGAALLLLAATGVFGQLKDALDTVWEVQPRKGRTVARWIRERFASFLTVLGAGVLLLASLAASAVLGMAGGRLGGGSGALLLSVGNVVASLAVATILFAMIFRILPDVEVAWRDVFAGAFLAAVLFVAGKGLVGVYLGRSVAGSVYGAAGALVVVMVWVYYSALVLFLGAEFAQVWARRRGRGVRPSRGATWIDENARREQGMPHRRPA